MPHHPELSEVASSFITVMTSRDTRQIHAVVRDAAQDDPDEFPLGARSPEAFQALIHDGAAFFLAYLGDEPVGMAAYRWGGGAMHVFHVAVKTSHQRCGVARRLLQAVEAVGFALGASRATLEVRQIHAPDLPLARYGYKADPEARPIGGPDRCCVTKALA